MENYGIKSEGEIFSGCICEMRNRISDKDQDDMSFYNTNEVIEKKVTNLFREFREDFFQVSSPIADLSSNLMLLGLKKAFSVGIWRLAKVH